MPDNVAPETTEQAQESVTDVTEALEKMTAAFTKIGPHLEQLVEYLGKLQPIEAAKQVPEAAAATVQGVGEAAGAGAEAAGHAVATVPAAAGDVLETTGAAAQGTKRAIRYTLRKRR